MRLFIAIDLDRYADTCKALQQQLHGYRLTHSYHITLHFLGEVGDPAPIIEALDDVHHPRFDIALRGMGEFSKGRVVFIKAQGDGLVSLHNMILTALDQKSDKGFKPHVTLGRSKNNHPIPQFSLNIPDIRIDRFTLYQSLLTVDGPVYTVLKTFPLRND